MAIARLLVPFLALAAWAAAHAQGPAQQQPVRPATGTVQLPPASGAWADSGLVVAEGDRLSFRVQPADPVSARLMAAFPPPTYRARAGDREFPISLDSPAVAPAAGPLQLEVQYPQGRQLPPSRLPHVTMTVTDEPRPTAAGSGPAKGPELGSDAAPVGNRVAGVAGGNRRTIPDSAAPNRTTTIGDQGPSARAAKGPDWTLIALAAAGLAVGLGTALALHLTPDGMPAPAVTIDPSLDTAEGAVAGDAIVPDGPEVRLRGVLEPGEIRFAGGEPVISKETRDG